MKTPTSSNSVTHPSSTYILLFVLFFISFPQRTEATARKLLNLKELKATLNPSVTSIQAPLISVSTDTFSLGFQRINSKEIAQLRLANPARLVPSSKTRQFKWKVVYMFGTPDSEGHGLTRINGQFPGPAIRAKTGDTVSVDIIQWDGITELETPIPLAKETASVSPYTINPAETLIYRFKVNKAGTYFYHGHFGKQRLERLYGSLIVEVGNGETEPFYDGEFNQLLSDSWHRVHDQEATSKPFLLPSRKLQNDEDKEFKESKASVNGSASEPASSE